jgi:hypothetical protein
MAGQRWQIGKPLAVGLWLEALHGLLATVGKRFHHIGAHLKRLWANARPQPRY